MDRATSALYEPMIERDPEGIALAARGFADASSSHELWLAVTRFAVLAWAPSQHSRRALMACRAAFDLRDESDRTIDLLIECARYAANSRRPWSEPPILDPPPPDGSQVHDEAELRGAIATKDRDRAERWLASRQAAGQPVDLLRAVVSGDALLTADTVLALEPHLGEQGRWALLRLAIEDAIESDPEEDPDAALDTLLADAIDEEGSIESVRRVFMYDARHESKAGPPLELPRIEPYELARDFAQTLIAHSVIRRLPVSTRSVAFIEAVQKNLREGENFAAWSQA